MKLSWALAFFFSAAASDGATVPAIALRGGATDATPLWVSMAAAVDEGGQLRTALLPRWRVQSMQQLRDIDALRRRNTPQTHADTEGSPCRTFIGEVPVESLTPSAAQSSASVVDRARGIYAGDVVSVTPGFFDGLPASLLEVKLVRAAKADREHTIDDRVYVVYPAAEFVIDGTAYCSRARFNSHVPRAGERVMLFIMRDAVDAERRIVQAESRDVIFGTAAGVAAAPELRAELGAVAGLDEVFETIVQRLAKRAAAPSPVSE